MGKFIFALVVAAAVAAFFLFGPRVGLGATAPDFAGYSARGKEIALSDYRGKLVILDFWASWCGPCRKAIPAMQRIHEQHAENGVVVLGVQVSDDADAFRFMHDMKATFPTLVQGDAVAKAYGVRGLPTIVVIDPAGTIVWQKSGWNSAYHRELEDVIAQHAP